MNPLIQPIVAPTYPLPSLSMNIDLGENLDTVRRNIRNYNITMGGQTANQMVDDHTVVLGPSNVWMSNPNETIDGLIVQTNQPVTLTVSNPDGVVFVMPINSFYASDCPLVLAKVVNPSTTVTANVYISTITVEVDNGGPGTINYYGVLVDPGIYDAALINQLLPGGPGIANIFSVNAGTNQYIWYAYPTSEGTASFQVNGFVGGFTLMTTTAMFNGFNYTIYRSDNPDLGQTSVSVF